MPTSSTSHGVRRVVVTAAIAAADQPGSDTNCWRRLSLQRRFFFLLELSRTTLPLSDTTLSLVCLTQHKEHTHTHA